MTINSNKHHLLKIIALPILFQLISTNSANAELLYPVEISSQTPQVRINRINIESSNNQMILSGRVKKRAPNVHVIQGHIDYLILSSNGKIIASNAINYSPRLLHKRSKFGSLFNFVLPDNLPVGSTIKIGWHQNSSKKHLSSAAFHQSNSLL